MTTEYITTETENLRGRVEHLEHLLQKMLKWLQVQGTLEKDSIAYYEIQQSLTTLFHDEWVGPGHVHKDDPLQLSEERIRQMIRNGIHESVWSAFALNPGGDDD